MTDGLFVVRPGLAVNHDRADLDAGHILRLAQDAVYRDINFTTRMRDRSRHILMRAESHLADHGRTFPKTPPKVVR